MHITYWEINHFSTGFSLDNFEEAEAVSKFKSFMAKHSANLTWWWNQQMHIILYYRHSMLPTYFGHTCGHLREAHYKRNITKVFEQNILHLCIGSKYFCNIPFVISLRMAKSVAETCRRHNKTYSSMFIHICHHHIKVSKYVHVVCMEV